MEQEIIKAINERMTELGISRRQLSKQCGLSEQFLYLFSNKGGNISISSLAKICEALGLQIEVVKTNME